MSEDTLLAALNVSGSVLCWWPAIVGPNRAIPLWLPLALVAFGTAVSAMLHNQGWLRFVAASTFGTMVGLCVGFGIWRPTDPLAAPYVGYVVASATLVTFFVSLFMGLVGRRMSVSNRKFRGALWFTLGVYVAFGPMVLALTPPLVTHKLPQ